MLIIITGRARSSARQYKQNYTRYKGIGVCACWSDKCLVDPSFKRCLIAPRRGHKDKGGEPRMNGYGHPPDRTRHLFFFTSDTTHNTNFSSAPYRTPKTHKFTLSEYKIYLAIAFVKKAQVWLLRAGPQTCEDGKVRPFKRLQIKQLNESISTRKQNEVSWRVYTTEK